MDYEIVGRIQMTWRGFVSSNRLYARMTLPDLQFADGYDILAATLRRNSSLINTAGFEALFEFLGLNHRSPE